jgi:hypothetical protein
MNIERELAYICKDLRLLGENNLTDQALCAYAAITDTEKPRSDLSYSYIMRKLRKGDSDIRLKFQKSFKKAFDNALYEDIDNPVEIALMVAIKEIDFTD